MGSSCYTGPEQPVDSAKTGIAVFDKQKAGAFIDSVNARFTEEVRNGDSVALASHYSSDAELLFSNMEPIKGKDIVLAWGSIIRMGVKDFNLKTTDISGAGDLLVETGAYELKSANKTLIDKGKYVVVWKQQSGVWKLFRDIGNTSLPAPAAK
jgi:ketosteroid isomerase-like protein